MGDYQCTRCTYVGSHKSVLEHFKQVELQHLPKVYICRLCPAAFHRQQPARKHKNLDHGKKGSSYRQVFSGSLRELPSDEMARPIAIEGRQRPRHRTTPYDRPQVNLTATTSSNVGSSSSSTASAAKGKQPEADLSLSPRQQQLHEAIMEGADVDGPEDVADDGQTSTGIVETRPEAGASLAGTTASTAGTTAPKAPSIMGSESDSESTLSALSAEVDSDASTRTTDWRRQRPLTTETNSVSMQQQPTVQHKVGDNDPAPQSSSGQLAGSMHSRTQQKLYKDVSATKDLLNDVLAYQEAIHQEMATIRTVVENLQTKMTSLDTLRTEVLTSLNTFKQDVAGLNKSLSHFLQYHAIKLQLKRGSTTAINQVMEGDQVEQWLAMTKDVLKAASSDAEPDKESSPNTDKN